MRLTEVTLRVKPDKTGLYEKTFHDLRAKVLANEPGCAFFEVWHDPADPGRYRVFEAYRSPDAITAHLATDYYKAAMKLFEPCLEPDSASRERFVMITDPEVWAAAS
jgi:quinol monooxygenase YgiN